jgi:hypothetical protein
LGAEVKKLALSLLCIASALFGLLAIVNLLYNLDPLFGCKQCSSRDLWEHGLVALACAALAFGSCFLCCKLFSWGAFREDSN